MDHFKCENCDCPVFTTQRGYGVLRLTCVNCATHYYLSLSPDRYPWPAPDHPADPSKEP